MRRARSMTRWRWRASLTGDGPTTNAGRSSAAARTSTASRFVAVSSGGTRSRPSSIVVSLAPNEKTTRIAASTASRGRASRSQRERMSREVSRRTPRLYGVSAMPAAWAAATLRPTQPRPVSSPTPATSESPKNKTRTSRTRKRTISTCSHPTRSPCAQPRRSEARREPDSRCEWQPNPSRSLPQAEHQGQAVPRTIRLRDGTLAAASRPKLQRAVMSIRLLPVDDILRRASRVRAQRTASRIAKPGRPARSHNRSVYETASEAEASAAQPVVELGPACSAARVSRARSSGAGRARWASHSSARPSAAGAPSATRPSASATALEAVSSVHD